MHTERPIEVEVNGVSYRGTVDVRTSLADFLREELGLVGTHLGCEQGVCGACTVLLDGRSVRACILLAVQVDGQEITTVEGLDEGGNLHPVQQAFQKHHGLQCGFCTAGFLMTIIEFLGERREVGDAEVREAISGNLCRCTGYQGIVDAIKSADATWERPVREDVT